MIPRTAKSSKTDFYITEVSRPDAAIEPYPMHGAPASVVEVEPDSVEEWTILNFTHKQARLLRQLVEEQRTARLERRQHFARSEREQR